jgi:hypothetical protein
MRFPHSFFPIYSGTSSRSCFPFVYIPVIDGGDGWPFTLQTADDVHPMGIFSGKVVLLEVVRIDANILRPFGQGIDI